MRTIRSFVPSARGLALVAGGAIALPLTTPLEPSGHAPTALVGCELIVAELGGARCRFEGEPPRELVIWIDEDVLEPTVTLHDSWSAHALAFERTRIGAGTQLVIEVDAPGTLEIIGDIGPDAEERRWTLALEPQPSLERFHAIWNPWEAGTQDAATTIDDLAALADDSDDPWMVAKTWEARAELLGLDDPSAATAAFEEAYLGLGAEELAVRCRILRKLYQMQSTSGASPDALEATHARMGECAALGIAHGHAQAYREGYQRFLRNDYAEAITQLRAAVAGAERLRVRDIEQAASGLLASTLARVQRFDEADAVLDRMLDLADELPPDCEAAVGLAGQVAALATERRLGHWADDPAPLHRLERSLDTTCRMAGVGEQRRDAPARLRRAALGAQRRGPRLARSARGGRPDPRPADERGIDPGRCRARPRRPRRGCEGPRRARTAPRRRAPRGQRRARGPAGLHRRPHRAGPRRPRRRRGSPRAPVTGQDEQLRLVPLASRPAACRPRKPSPPVTSSRCSASSTTSTPRSAPPDSCATATPAA